MAHKRASLHNHRVIDVRREQRAALLAYGFLRGRAYRQIESHPRYLRTPSDRPGPNWLRVAEIVAKFGPDEGDKKQARDKLKEWGIVPLVDKEDHNERHLA